IPAAPDRLPDRTRAGHGLRPVLPADQCRFCRRAERATAAHRRQSRGADIYDHGPVGCRDPVLDEPRLRARGRHTRPRTRGSTGYGREYRERLKGQWGIVDTEDCIDAARFLAREGEVDGQRLAIRGGSAGGYTTLCALVFHDDFAAGASYYGVADCEALAKD